MPFLAFFSSFLLFCYSFNQAPRWLQTKNYLTINITHHHWNIYKTRSLVFSVISEKAELKRPFMEETRSQFLAKQSPHLSSLHRLSKGTYSWFFFPAQWCLQTKHLFLSNESAIQMARLLINNFLKHLVFIAHINRLHIINISYYHYFCIWTLMLYPFWFS